MADRLDPAIWYSLTRLAERQGVKHQSIRDRVNRLEKRGLLTTKTEGRKRLVNIAEFDQAIGEDGNGAREMGEATKRGEAGGDAGAETGLRAAQTERATYEAEMARLKMEAAKGNSFTKEAVEQVYNEFAGVVLRALDSLPSEIVRRMMDACSMGDQAAATREARGIVRDTRAKIESNILQPVRDAEGERSPGGDSMRHAKTETNEHEIGKGVT
ncbi:MAG: hypothetical protein AAF903_12330 [Pseudomonadota bacterium]